MDVPRFVSIVSGLSTAVQSIAWTILSLLAVLSYACSIKARGVWDFGDLIAIYYFQGCDRNMDVAGLTPPSTMAIITSIYLFLSVAWFVSSAMWLHSLRRNKNDRMHHIFESAWIGVTIATSLFDLGVVITFGVDYNKSDGNSTAVALMSIAARGYVLWLLNTAAAIYLAVHITRPYETQKEPHTLHSHPAPFYNPEILERSIPHPWIVQSPTVGNEPRQIERDYDARSGVIYAKDLLRREPPPPAVRSEPRQPERDYNARSGVIHAKDLLRREPPPPGVRSEPQQPERDYDARSGVIHAKDFLRREPPPLNEVPRRPALKTQPSKTSVSYESPGRRQISRQASALSATFFQQARPAPFKLGPPRPPRRPRTIDE